ncbi:MAG TPA: hypothetical protein VHV83_20920 [Armatimonadota bacterium]|nr:hypothetical protein [Armatimonadota bacterium]
MFYCGGDQVAKASVATLIADSGFEAVDAGGLTCARYLEALAMLMIHLASTQRLGRIWGSNCNVVDQKTERPTPVPTSLHHA